MSELTKIEKEARRFCRHTVVFVDIVQQKAAAMGLQGMTTKAVAARLNITESQAQYRIAKAQDFCKTKFRADYRNGTSSLALQMQAKTEQIALRAIRERVTPHFRPLAAPGVPRQP